MKIKKILITGSEGYIGNSIYEILKNKYKIFCIDKVKSKYKTKRNLYKVDLNNKVKLKKLLYNLKPDLILHFAAKSTIDDIKKVSKYERDNVKATSNLVSIAKQLKIKKFIFSSTAAVYGENNIKIKETSIKNPNNIYGKTKLNCENLIKNKFQHTDTNYIILRFFNVCAALRKEKAGEMHTPETHFFPLIINKFINKKKIKIYGKKYKTKDGTCIRDYIHIRDICSAVQKCIKYMEIKKKNEIINLGSGKGYSILEIIKFFQSHFGNIKYEFLIKRKGDVDKLVCSISKADKILKWKPKFSKLKNIISDEIYWQKYLNKKKIIRKFIY